MNIQEAFYSLLTLFKKLLSSQIFRSPKAVNLHIFIVCPASLEGCVSGDVPDFSLLQYGCLQGQQLVSLDADYSFHLAYKLYFAPTELKSVHLMHYVPLPTFSSAGFGKKNAVLK